MKNQALFFLTDKSTKIKCRLLQFLVGALRVKFPHVNCGYCLFYFRKDGLVADIFDHLVNLIVDISKTSETRLKGKEMYDKFRIPLFRNMESNKV